MSEKRKKHYGDPISKKPISFGKHYAKYQQKECIINNNLEDKPETDLENTDFLAMEQMHRHALEDRIFRNNAIANIVGILSWLFFCVILLYVAVTEAEKNITVAITVPVAGFFMVCCLAYLNKKNYSKTDKRHHFSSNKSSNNFRKPFVRSEERRGNLPQQSPSFRRMK